MKFGARNHSCHAKTPAPKSLMILIRMRKTQVILPYKSW